MNKKLFFTLISFILITFIFAVSAEAKRFGGGASFGGKKSYSSPFKQRSTQHKSFSQQKAAASNQQRKQQLASRGGLMGMLGGLALGGLLGALFFGGAFENFNFFDFIIIGGIIWAVIWFMKRKALAPQAQTAATGGFNTNMGTPPPPPSQSQENNSPAQFKLNSDKQDATFSENFSANKESSNHNKEASFADSFGMDYGQSHNNEQTEQNSESSSTVILPGWFNQEEFLSGARSAYTLLQQAWDKGDLEAIKELTTDTVYTEITHQFSQKAPQGETRILQLNATLIDFNERDDHSEASVLFDALLDEEANANNQGRANQVKELWHFVRGKNSSQPTWYLDGIQQLD
ncbi:MAG: 39S ribosomal protein L45 [gamma proteobacterium symbiont of Bathyaustriella thionipta]|nr:39S ribosomal protein L45 [gamma proteobacterium symbiont of Bathyaustriella thionipta]